MPSRSFPEPHRSGAGGLAACRLPDGGWAIHLPPPPPAWNESADGGPRTGLGRVWPVTAFHFPAQRVGWAGSRPAAMLGPWTPPSHFLLGPNCHSPCRAEPHTGWKGGEGELCFLGKEGPGLGFLACPEATAFQPGPGSWGQGRRWPRCLARTPLQGQTPASAGPSLASGSRTLAGPQRKTPGPPAG